MAFKLKVIGHAFAAQTNATLVIHQGKVVDAMLHPTRDFYPQVQHALVLEKLTCEPLLNVPGFAIAFKRSILHACPWDRRPADPNTYDIPFAHDTWILFIAEIFGSVVWIPESLVLYRRHDFNTTKPIAKIRRSETLRQRLKSKLALIQKQYVRRANLFDECADLLDDLSRRCDAPIANDLLAASQRYRRFASVYARRAVLYDVVNPFSRRLAALRALQACSAYAPWSQGGVSNQALRKDLRYVLFASLAD